MINESLIAIGIILMAYSIVVSGTITSTMDSDGIRKYWKMLTVLMVFFLFGYIAFLFALLFPEIGFTLSNSLVSVIFMFGAGFVLLVMKLSDRMIGSSLSDNQKLKEMNISLKEKTRQLNEKKREVDRQKKELGKKNRELEKTLEEFYTLRLGLARDLRAGKVEKENRIIRRKLDNLKKAKS